MRGGKQGLGGRVEDKEAAEKEGAVRGRVGWATVEEAGERRHGRWRRRLWR